MKLEFHHINFVADDVDRMHDFYTNVLGLDDMPITQFPRTEASEGKGFDGKIRFATDGATYRPDQGVAEWLNDCPPASTPWWIATPCWATRWPTACRRHCTTGSTAD